MAPRPALAVASTSRPGAQAAHAPTEVEMLQDIFESLSTMNTQLTEVLEKLEAQDELIEDLTNKLDQAIFRADYPSDES